MGGKIGEGYYAKAYAGQFANIPSVAIKKTSNEAESTKQVEHLSRSKSNRPQLRQVESKRELVPVQALRLERATSKQLRQDNLKLTQESKALKEKVRHWEVIYLKDSELAHSTKLKLERELANSKRLQQTVRQRTDHWIKTKVDLNSTQSKLERALANSKRLQQDNLKLTQESKALKEDNLKLMQQVELL